MHDKNTMMVRYVKSSELTPRKHHFKQVSPLKSNASFDFSLLPFESPKIKNISFLQICKNGRTENHYLVTPTHVQRSCVTEWLD